MEEKKEAKIIPINRIKEKEVIDKILSFKRPKIDFTDWILKNTKSF